MGGIPPVQSRKADGEEGRSKEITTFHGAGKKQKARGRKKSANEGRQKTRQLNCQGGGGGGRAGEREKGKTQEKSRRNGKGKEADKQGEGKVEREEKRITLRLSEYGRRETSHGGERGGSNAVVTNERKWAGEGHLKDKEGIVPAIWGISGFNKQESDNEEEGPAEPKIPLMGKEVMSRRHENENCH